MSHDMSFIGLFLQASLVVKLVMILLMVASIVSWAFIVQRTRVLNSAKHELFQFEEQFWSGTDLNTLFQELSARGQIKGVHSIFVAGFREFVRLRKSEAQGEVVVEGSSRAMRVALSQSAADMHTILRAILLLLVLLHVFAVLVHIFVWRQNILKRMWPFDFNRH